MTRPELSAAIRALADTEKLELLEELWDALEHTASVPDWHREELDRRLEATEGDGVVAWPEARARILGTK